MDYSDVINVEVSCDVWKTVNAGFSHQVAEEISVVGNLGGN